MKYKYKFNLKNKEDGTQLELATCSDEMTANLLADHYKKLYDNKKFEVLYSFKHKKIIL